MEFIIQNGLHVLPRVAPDYSNRIRDGQVVHFRQGVGPINQMFINRVRLTVGNGHYEVTPQKTEFALHVKIKNGNSVEQLVPIHLLMPVEVTIETDFALSCTRFSSSDDVEFTANYVIRETNRQSSRPKHRGIAS